MTNRYGDYTIAALEEEMEKELGVTAARRQLSTIIDEVRYRGDNYVIVKHGEPAAAIVPMSLYRKWQRDRQELFAAIREVQQKNLDADPDEVMEEVLAAQQAVRRVGDSQAP